MFIGRNYEIEQIQNRLLDRNKAQLIIVYGRRRVGKSRLIREATRKERKVLFFEGIEGGSSEIQIEHFLRDLAQQTGKIKLDAKNWKEVFQGLEEIVIRGRYVLVFDEFPWMAVGRTQLIAELKPYWDKWSLRNKNLCLFLCGSVSSFMVKHLVHSKALHNRKTLELCVKPLTPQESGHFIEQRSILEKTKLYMTFGGVPKYLEQIDKRFSLEKNINETCFKSGGFFVHEFETLFKEQFKVIKVYTQLAQALAKHPANVSDLSKTLKLAKGGGLNSQLENLVHANFVRSYYPVSLFDKKKTKTKLYKLIDPFLIFYFHYIRSNIDLIELNQTENLFDNIARPSIATYYGLAFERFCEDSILQILKRLKISLGEIKSMGPFFQQKSLQGDGVQIDWLIIRKDQVLTLLEYKFTLKPVGKEIISEIEQKIKALPNLSKFTIEKVLVSAQGASADLKKAHYFSSILELKDLF